MYTSVFKFKILFSFYRKYNFSRNKFCLCIVKMLLYYFIYSSGNELMIEKVLINGKQ